MKVVFFQCKEESKKSLEQKKGKKREKKREKGVLTIHYSQLERENISNGEVSGVFPKALNETKGQEEEEEKEEKKERTKVAKKIKKKKKRKK